MTDASWDSEASPRKKGMPFWAKLSLGCCGGCALLFVLALVTCVGGARYISTHGVPDVVDRAVGSAFLDKAWGEMDHVVKALATDQGTRDLYRENPGLSENFQTEEEFLQEAQEWRPRLGQFPTQRPTLQALIHQKHGDGHFRVHTSNNTTRIDYQIPGGGRLHLELESDKLVDLRVE